MIFARFYSNKILILAVSCLLTACQLPGTTPHRSEAGTGSDSAAIFQNQAYEEMFNGSLAKAETYAYRAFLMSQDSTLECNALSLLCYIYYRAGKQEELAVLKTLPVVDEALAEVLSKATSVVTPCPSVTRRWRQMPISGVLDLSISHSLIAVGRLRERCI